jgi:hypothetical protein
MVVDRPLKKSGAPPAVNPDAIFSSFFSKSMRLWGSEKERDRDRVKGVGV